MSIHKTIVSSVYKRYFSSVITVVFGFILWSSSVFASINETINFQGKLTNLDGTNFTGTCGTSCKFEFSIYDVSSGGSALWSETQTGIAVTGGIFNVKLGSVTGFAGYLGPSQLDNFNKGTLYLQIKVDANNNSTYEASEIFGTRLLLSAVPYAWNSRNLDGRASTGFVQLAPSAVQTDTSTLASIFLNKTGASGNLMQLQKNAGDMFVIDNTGKVGIGTASPTSMLSVGATSQFQVNTSGNIVKLNNITTSFPSVQGAANTYLKNDGAGTLTWEEPAGTGTGFVQLAPTAVQTDTSTLASIFLNKTGASGNLMQLQKNAGDMFVINNTGMVGIGTATPVRNLDIIGTFGVRPSGSGYPLLNGGLSSSWSVVHGGGNWGLTVARNTADAGYSNFGFFKTRSTDVSVNVPVQNGDGIGRFTWQAVAPDNNAYEVAGLYSQVSGTPSGANIPVSWYLHTNQQIRLLVDSSGYVGIGTVSPTSMFSVGATSQFQVNTSGDIVKLNNITTSFPSVQGVANSFLRNNGAGILTWADPAGTGTAGYWQRSGTSIAPTNIGDNVGIGTASPGYPLDIKKTVGAVWGTMIPMINLNAYYTGFDENAVRATIDAGIPPISFNNTTYGQMGFSTRGADGLIQRMTIYPNGNVGIGTTAPGEKLDITGNVRISQSNYLKFPHSSESDANDGKIGAALFGTGLNLVGSKTDTTYRKFSLFGEITQLQNGGTNTWVGTNYFSGNVGIGTTTPLSKLSINGGLHVGGDSDAGDNNLIVDGTFRAANVAQYYTTRTISQTLNDWVELGTISTNVSVQPLKYTVTINQHSNEHQDSVTYTGFNFVTTTSPNWLMIPPNNGFSYIGRTTSLEAQQGADVYTVKLRIRNLRTGGGPGTAYITVAVDNGTFIESSVTGTAGTVVSGYAAGSTGWYFPVQASAQYAPSTNGLFIQNTGYVGIGTTTPVTKFDVTLGASGHVPMLYSTNTMPQFPRTLQNISASITTNDITVATGPVIGINLENSSQTNNTYSPLITFSRHSENGAYNPTYASIGGIATGNGADASWTAGDLVFGTTAYAGPLERMRISSSGNVGVGTTNPQKIMDIVATGAGSNALRLSYTISSIYTDLYTDASGYFRIDPSSADNRVVIGDGATGKLDVGTIDPLYTVDGKTYATYVASMIGQKEELSRTINTKEYDPIQKAFYIDINFSKSIDEELFVFQKISDFGIDWQNLNVIVSGDSPLPIWYKKNISENTIRIFSKEQAEVSYRLTANRFDASKWLFDKGTDYDTKGFIVE